MKQTHHNSRGLKRLFIGSCLMSFALTGVQAQSTEALQERVRELEAELAKTKKTLAMTERVAKSNPDKQKMAELEDKLANAADTGPSKITPGDLIPAVEGLKIGGAIRANYVIGNYDDATKRGGATRDDGGAFGLDTFRLNFDYERGSVVGKAEYRFYPGYNGSNSDSYHFVHTAWLGYNFQSGDQIQIGVNRVPFGPGPYGVSKSWLFDQHYYVGLSDDMDLGAKYTMSRGNWAFDFALYAADEGNGTGNNFSSDSVRYSYDVVDESGAGYEERGQANIRAVYSTSFGEIDADLGGSFQYGNLDSNGPQDDGEMFAFSGHADLKWQNWTLTPQLTYYSYDVDANQPLGTDELVQMGAYDFATLVAAEAWIPAISLSYYYETPQVDWLDYIIPYAEYSSIVKEENDFNDSEMLIVGSAFGRGGWFIYADLAFSNGNDFIGNEGGFGATSAGVTPGGFTSNRFGENPDEDWQTRFNINFGYYF